MNRQFKQAMQTQQSLVRQAKEEKEDETKEDVRRKTKKYIH